VVRHEGLEEGLREGLGLPRLRERSLACLAQPLRAQRHRPSGEVKARREKKSQMRAYRGRIDGGEPKKPNLFDNVDEFDGETDLFDEDATLLQ